MSDRTRSHGSKDKPLTDRMRKDREPVGLKEYEAAGGYQAVRKALGRMSPQDVTEEVKKSNLRGRGGAGFPTGMKWGFVPMGERRAPAQVHGGQRG